MAINGIHSYGMGYYNYQSSINNMRLVQALSNNPKLQQSAVSPIPPVKDSLSSNMDFVKSYTSSMSDLMNSANQLRESNSAGVMNDLTVTSSNEAIASATKKLTLKNPVDVELDVSQIAQAQSNQSSAVSASDLASESMDFTVGNGIHDVNVKVNAKNDDGTSKTNVQMLEEAASQINNGSANVKATVVQKDGTASLQVEGIYTGAAHSFNVSGSLGSASGLDQAATEAANAKYSVTMNNKTTQYESFSNDISIASAGLNVTLKGAGETTIKAEVDAEKVASAVGSLVDSYNSSLKLLNDNYDRGSGVYRQLRNLVGGLGSEQSLAQLGITVNKDATMEFDKDTLVKSLKENPSLTKDLISSNHGIADEAFTKAKAGMNTNSSSLINGSSEYGSFDTVSDSFRAFNNYYKNNAYAMNNYSALGMMFNMLV